VLLVGLAVQIALKAPLEHVLDWTVAIGLLLPATFDWALGRFNPHRFSNVWRTGTGALLGLALARSLFIHFQRPLPAVLLAQGLVVTVVALPVILTSYRRDRRK
jgi:hypothetical protein